MTWPLSAWRQSLRGRLLLLIGLAVVGAALVQAVLAYRSAQHEVDTLLDYQMQQTALALRAGMPANLQEATPSRLSQDENPEFIVQVWTNEGLRIFESAFGAALPQMAVLGFADVTVHAKTYRVFSLETPAQVIQVAQDLHRRRQMVGALAWRTLWPIALLAPVLWLAVWWVVGQALRPLERVRQEVAGRAADALAPVAVHDLPTEVLPLAQEVNALFARVQQAFESQQHFVADAAHALRSPLQALRLQLQWLQRAPDQEARAQALQRLAAGIERATQLVDKLLLLAREDARQQAASVLPGKRVDVAALAQQQVADMALSAHAAQIDLGITEASVAQAWVLADAASVQVLLRNVLDNALKYTPTGGQVDVQVLCVPASCAQGAQVQLQVHDSGPGIPRADRARMLERFVRAENTTAQGSGLGLAIVQAIAQRHGAQVQLLESAHLGGLCVQVSWPAAVAS